LSTSGIFWNSNRQQLTLMSVINISIIWFAFNKAIFLIDNISNFIIIINSMLLTFTSIRTRCIISNHFKPFLFMLKLYVYLHIPGINIMFFLFFCLHFDLCSTSLATSFSFIVSLSCMGLNLIMSYSLCYC
jgi:hypothetical protein